MLHDVAERATRYLNRINDRPVAGQVADLPALDEPFPESGTAAAEVIRLLDEIGSPATTASAGSRYFGFVTGGALPVTVAANWLATAWDQNAAGVTGGAVPAKLETVALGWLVDIFGLPPATAGGFVTGATMANFSGLVAARHFLLERAGWDVEADGLFAAPEIKVVVGAEYHASMKKALSLAGFGRDRVTSVPVDDQGRMVAAQLPPLDDMTLVCAQSGNVNSGAFDPLPEIGAACQAAGAWLHVDGEFGSWAAASPTLKPLTAGLERADSICTDFHKWLNVPYDSGLILCRHGAALRGAMTSYAPYLVRTEQREPMEYTPEMSRRARGVEVWAALKSLGRDGLADLIERCCRHARHFAEGLTAAGFTVLNEVVLNQVVVTFGDDTERVIAAIQQDGTFWAGPTHWQGHQAMRISVSNWATTTEDVERSLAALIRLAKQEIVA